MILVRFSDGLGNQMFQYAFARLLSHQSGLPLIYDLDWYRNGEGLSRPDRPFVLDQYRLAAREATSEEIASLSPVPWLWRIAQKAPNLVSLCPWRRLCLETADSVIKKADSFRLDWFNHAGQAFVSGYFASYRYAEVVRSELLQELDLTDHVPDEVRSICDRLRGETSVAVCHRRGDYAAISPLGVMQDAYYLRAVSRMRERVAGAKFYGFSDEPDAAARVLGPLGVQVVEWANAERPSPQKLEILRACRHYILANSTFGWWGAWLGQTDASVVIHPSQWFLGLERQYANLFPPYWLSMTVDPL